MVSTRTGLHTEETELETRKMHAGEVAVTKPPVEVEDRGQDTGQNHKGRCRYCHNCTYHGWQNCPLRLWHEAEDAKVQNEDSSDEKPGDYAKIVTLAV